MGLEFRDAAYTLGAKCGRTLKSNMIFSLTLGFNNIPDAKNAGKTYAVSLVDTVKVGKNGGSVLSEGMKGKDDVMFYMEVRALLASSDARDSSRLNPLSPAGGGQEAFQVFSPGRCQVHPQSPSHRRRQVQAP